MRSLRTVIAVGLVAALSFPAPVFAGPATTGAPLLSGSVEGFEDPTSPNYAIESSPWPDGSAPVTWGRFNKTKKSGSYSLWCSGSDAALVSSYRYYSTYAKSDAVFPIAQSGDLYSADVSFAYTNPSMGINDKFYANWGAEDNEQWSAPSSPPPSSGWRTVTYDMGDSIYGMSRRPGSKLRFHFENVPNDADGLGPSIDDVAVYGWRYGPPRSLAATSVGSSVRLSWQRPYAKMHSSELETRTIFYRAWWADGGLTNWTDINPAITNVSENVSVDLPLVGEGRPYRYAVQTYDSSNRYGRAALTTITVSSPPNVSLTAPANNFVLSGTPVRITGTSSDVGSGVGSVQVRIRRADGSCLNNLTPLGSWVAGDTWINATQESAGWASWAATWTPTADVLASGQIVSVTARATDGTPLTTTTDPVSSQVPMVASVTLGAGASTTTQSDVRASISAPGANAMRWSVDGGGTWTTWNAYSTEATVTLPAPDGTKAVTFQFSKDGGASLAASATDSIVLHTSVPSVAINAPAPLFSLGSPISITGTSADLGGTVTGVGVCIQRADGLTWNGSAWTSAETWLQAASSNGYSDWSLAWTPDATVRASGKSVTLTARATDFAGLTGSSATVTSAAPILASVTLDGGASYAVTTTVNASLSTTGTPNKMRWSVNGGAYGAWESYSASKDVTLPAGDGTKTVTFQLSSTGGASVEATASDSIVLHTSAPVVSIAQPMSAFSLASVPVTITGSATDVGGTVAGVELRIARSDGSCWNGSTWTPGQTWLPAIGTSNWSYYWAPSVEQIAAGQIVTISARATDMAGLSGAAAPISSSVSVAAAVSLNGGAAFATTTDVVASIATTGTPSKMRWNVNGGAFSAWQNFSSTANVALTSGDGSKTVAFEFSSNPPSVDATASDSILLHSSIPAVTIATPANSFSLNSPSVSISGTSYDEGGTIASTEIRVRRSDGYCWNGFAWTPTDFWLPVAGGNWSYLWAVPAAEQLAGRVVSVTARATDAVGLVGTSATRSSAVGVAAAISLQAGAPHTTSRDIVGSIATTGTPTHMRWSNDGVAYGPWQPFDNVAAITLPAGDGVKRVWCQLSSTGGASVEASASDDIVLHTSVPTVSISAPTAGFRLSAKSTRIAGTADDAGASVSSVEIVIRRSSGACWNGQRWVTGPDVWLPAVGTVEWSYDWTLAAEDIIPGEIVTIEARATDAFGLVSPASVGVPSAVPIAAQVSLASGAQFSASLTVTADVSSIGATSYRYQVDGGALSDWAPFVGPSSVIDIPMGPSNGVRTATFQFSADSSHTVGTTASDSIIVDTGRPTATFSSATTAFPLDSGAVVLGGSAADNLSGVSAGTLRLMRSGEYWNGLAWQPDEFRLPISVASDGSWQYSWTPDPISTTGYLPVAAEFVAEDGAGNRSLAVHRSSVDPKEPTSLTVGTSAAIVAYGGTAVISGSWTATESGSLAGKPVYLEYLSGSWKRLAARTTDANGVVAFSVKPTAKTTYRLAFDADADFAGTVSPQTVTVTPKVYLSTPSTPSSARRNTKFYTYGSLKPRHSSGSYAVKFYCYRYERGTYKLRKTVSMKVKNYSSYSRYYGYLSLPYSGKWRIRAYHGDSAHAATYSSYRYITIK